MKERADTERLGGYLLFCYQNKPYYRMLVKLLTSRLEKKKNKSSIFICTNERTCGRLIKSPAIGNRAIILYGINIMLYNLER